MTVKEANKYIENIDNEIKNLQKLLTLPDEKKKALEENANFNNTIVGVVNTAVNCMCAYKNILKEKIDNAQIN
ncbi:hypothetical protein DXC24_14800 [Clostridium sp. OM08-29]|jgi:hypothetical protein|nr:hypothetical protein DXC24_14800 [Clostridium sp. OM08-29]